MSQTARTAPLRPGDEVELSVDSLAHGGNGVARLDGYVVFVHGGVPGDRVRARVVKRKRGYAEARAVEIVEPSPERIPQRAPHPGAPWQVLPYARQLREKERLVGEALIRLGGFERPPVAPIVPAVAEWRYRNKLEYSFGGRTREELALGFHRAGRWDEIDDVDDDLLASERVDGVRARVRGWCRAEGLTPYDRRDGSGFLRNLVVREGRRTGTVQARIVTSEGDFRAADLAAAACADSFLWTRAGGVAETTRGGETDLVLGAAAIEEVLDGGGREIRYRISPDAFFQTNTEMAERLYGEAAELAGLTGGERVYDLYSGIGAIALALAGRAREVWGIELVEPAVADAIGNAALNDIGNVHFFAGDVRTALGPLRERAGAADVVVVDPPRAGLSAKVIRRMLEAEARRIVYVSCNPTTLAPNARQIADAGYGLAAVRPVDLFPQTPHIETVALFERRP